ncbi:MAG: hypothetical protein ABSB33_11595 [Tepidisphaeraceae bacterium]|jgi:hypothetical protein
MAKNALPLVQIKLKNGTGKTAKTVVSGTPIRALEDALAHPNLIEAIRRKIIEIDDENQTINGPCQ